MIQYQLDDVGLGPLPESLDPSACSGVGTERIPAWSSRTERGDPRAHSPTSVRVMGGAGMILLRGKTRWPSDSPAYKLEPTWPATRTMKGERKEKPSSHSSTENCRSEHNASVWNVPSELELRRQEVNTSRILFSIPRMKSGPEREERARVSSDGEASHFHGKGAELRRSDASFSPNGTTPFGGIYSRLSYPSLGENPPRKKMKNDGPEAALLRTRTTYGSDLETYARLELPHENLHWVGKASRADLSGVIAADLPKTPSFRSQLSKLWIALRPARAVAKPAARVQRVAPQIEGVAKYDGARGVRPISAIPLAALGTSELKPEIALGSFPVSASPAFRGTSR